MSRGLDMDTLAGGSPGQGRRRLRRAAIALGLVTLVWPETAWGQSLPDSYRVAGIDVPLTVHLDSLAVITPGPMGGEELGAILEMELGRPVELRPLAPRAWLFDVPEQTRDSLTHLASSLRALEPIEQAGLVVRLADEAHVSVVTNRFLVQFRPGTTRTEIDAVNTQRGVTVVGEPGLSPGLFLLTVDSGTPLDALEASQLYLADEATVYAHPDFYSSLEDSDVFPDDPLFDQQWHLHNPGAVVRPDIHAPEAWEIELGRPGVTIAILEQGGFDAAHPDLVDRLWENPWMTGTEPGPEPFNKTGDLHGWNFEGCPSTTNPWSDPCGTPDLAAPAGTSTNHGTAVAGVAGAEGDNAIGVSGVCPRCSLMLVRIGYTTSYVQAVAVEYAHAMGADVINMSFSAPFTTDVFIWAVGRAAVSGRGHRGITIVTAPTNYLGDTPICSKTILAAQDEVISIIRSNNLDQRQVGAMGPCLDLMSPGVGIWTTATQGTGPSGTDYEERSGNSFGAPVVAGVAGLLLSRNYELTRSEIYQILTTTADKVDAGGYGSAGHSDTHGYGRVNAWRALLAVPELAPDLDPDPAPIAPAGPEVGVRAGVTVLGGALSDRFLGAPGQGPMAAPVLYATLFPGAFLLDAQLGYARRWGPGTSAETRLHAALMLAYGYGLGSGTLYAGPSLAVRSIDLGGGATTEWGVGGATGFRKPLSTHLAARLEASYRWWGGPGVNEWGLGLGFGVRLP